MVLKFKRVHGAFPGDYVWVIDVTNRQAWAEYPNGDRKPPETKEPFAEMLDGAVTAVACGSWYEVDGKVRAD